MTRTARKLAKGLLELARWLLALGFVTLVLCALYVYQTFNETVRREVLAVFACHYQKLDVRLESARWVNGKGIEIAGLTIRERKTAGPQSLLLRIDRALLVSDATFRDLLAKRVHVKRIIIESGKLCATRRADGSWSVRNLWPPPSLGPVPPAVFVRNGRLEIFDPTSTPATYLSLHNLQIAVQSSQSTAKGLPARDVVSSLRTIVITGGSQWVKRFTARIVVDLDRGVADVQGCVAQLRFCRQFIACLPYPLQDCLEKLQGLTADLNLSFAMRIDSQPDAQRWLVVEGNCNGGRYRDGRLPELTDVVGTFRFDRNGLSIWDLSARCGRATIWVSNFRANELTLSNHWQLSAKVRGLEIDEQLLSYVSCLEDSWRQLQPWARINADIELAYTDGNYQGKVTAQVLDGGLQYQQLAYPVDKLNGWILWENGHLNVQLAGAVSGKPAQIRAQLDNVPTCPVGAFSFRASQVVLDRQLVSAMPSSLQRVLAALNLQGNFDIAYDAFLNAGIEKSLLQIELHDCSFSYDKFPYPVSRLSGTLTLAKQSDGTLRFSVSRLSGWNDLGQITVQGQGGRDTNGLHFALDVEAQNIAFDEELCQALPEEVRAFWNKLQLRGALRWLKGQVVYDDRVGRLELSFEAEPDSRITSIEPVWFPYRLEGISGHISYKDGMLRIRNLSAQHYLTQLSANVELHLLEGRGVRFVVRDLLAEQLPVDRSLLEALPVEVRRTLAGLDINGAVNLRGYLTVTKLAETDTAYADWDLAVDLHQAAANLLGLRIKNINGTLQFAGRLDENGPQCRGELDIDSVILRDRLQITQIRGPFLLSGNRLFVGALVDYVTTAQQTAGSARPISAMVFGGLLAANGWVSFTDAPQYQFQLSLSRADLSELARDVLKDQRRISGKLYAQVQLAGSGRSVNQLSGAGSIQLREADIWELPLMIAMLKLLSVKRPEPSAFSSADIAFRIQGQTIDLAQITFSGDAISLEGRGQADFDGRLQLVFRALLGRADRQLPFVRELMGRTSEQIVTIHVSGTLQNPIVRNEPFPLVNQMLEQLQSDGIQRGTIRSRSWSNAPIYR